MAHTCHSSKVIGWSSHVGCGCSNAPIENRRTPVKPVSCASALTVAGDAGSSRVDDRDAHEPAGARGRGVDRVRVVVGVGAERLHEHRGVDAGGGHERVELLRVAR